MDKRHEIIKKTAYLIHNKGYEQTSLKDIMATCEIGKGQFYHYFKSKEDLGLQVLDYVFEKWKTKLFDGILLSTLSPNDKIKQMYEWVTTIQNKTDLTNGCFFGNLGIEMSPHNELFRIKLKDIFDRWISHVASVLEAFDPTQQMRKESALETATSIVAVLEGGIMMTKINRDLKYLDNAFVTCDVLIATLLAKL